MESSPFLTHLPRLFKILVGYNVKSCKFNLWTVCYLISQIIAFGTSVYRFSLHKVPKTNIMEQMTLTSSLFVVLSGFTFLFKSRNKLGKLIEYLLEPIVTSGESTLKLKEFKIYTKWINSMGVFFLINMYLMFCCVTLVLKPVLTLKFYSITSEIQELPLSFGWIPFQTESYVVYYIAFIISFISDFGLGAFLTWQMTMSFSALKIKLTLKLLATDVRNFDEIVTLRTKYRMMELSMMSLEQVPGREKMKVSVECRKHLLRELIDRHLEAIGSVKLINDCYSLSALVLVQASSFIAALTLPRAIQTINQLVPEEALDYEYTASRTFSSLQDDAL
ncbi:hypothetical protein J6590_037484 [Homalodisca vitripennis]|nr:hypothetical protein J6590_037484 [Homalodisca vitripennis]